MRLTWVQPEDLLPHQLHQSRAEGVDTTAIRSRWVTAGGTTTAPVSGASPTPATPVLRTLARELLDDLDTRAPEWTPPPIPQLPVLDDAGESAFQRKVLNGWLGRA